LRILHLSDLHASLEEEAERKRLVRALLEDVERQRSEADIDVVVFSGDLSNTGIVEEFELADRLLLQPLRGKLDLPVERIVMTPGNHDVDRSRISPFVETGLSAQLNGPGDVERLLGSEKELELALDRLVGWRDFGDSGDYRPSPEEGIGDLAWTRRVTVGGRTLGLAVLDSAWRCSGPDDRGHLLAGSPQADQALDAISACDVRVAVIHHPLEWLESFEADQLRSRFEAEGVIVLSGHEHDPDPDARISPRGQAVFLRAGCLYGGGITYPNSYYLIDAEPDDESLVVRVRRWSERTGEFDAGTEYAHGGEHRFALPKGGTHRNLGHPPYSTVMSSIAAAAAELRVVPEDIAKDQPEPRSVKDVLVAPRFLSAPYREAQTMATLADGIDKAEVDAVAAVADTEVVLVSGDQQGGVTSALLWLLSGAYECDPSKMPAYTPLRESRLGTSREEETLTKAAGRFGHRKADSKSPDVLLAVDDVDPSETKRLARLLDFIKKNPRHRYLLGCGQEVAEQIEQALRGAGIEHAKGFLAPFGRTELRQLAVKTAGADADVERIYNVMREQNLPQTPFTMVALISVMNAGRVVASDLNESDLLEAFVNLLLGGSELADSENLGMDFKKRVTMLGQLARAMSQELGSSLTVAAAERLLLDYFDERDLALSATQVLNSLISRQVLISDGERVAFRSRALLSLFLGYWMLESEENKAALLADCAGHGEAIALAAGIAKDDVAILVAVREHARAVIEPLGEKISRSQIDSLLEDFESIEPWDGDKQLDSMLSSLPAQKSSRERDEEIDRIAAVLDKESVDISSDAVMTSIRVLDGATTLLSKVLRNSELVHRDLKRECLELAVDGWILLIGLTIAEDVHEDSSLREVIAEALVEHVETDEEMELVTRFLLLLLVLVVGSIAQARLGSRHLVKSLDACLENPEFAASPTASSIAVWTEGSLDFNAWPKRLSELLERLPPKTFLRNATIWIALQKFRSMHDAAAARRLRDMVAEQIMPPVPRGQNAPRQRELALAQIKEKLDQSRRSYQGGLIAAAGPESLGALVDGSSGGAS
jgi:predicted phosphodiesterase